MNISFSFGISLMMPNLAHFQPSTTLVHQQYYLSLIYLDQKPLIIIKLGLKKFGIK